MSLPIRKLEKGERINNYSEQLVVRQLHVYYNHCTTSLILVGGFTVQRNLPLLLGWDNAIC